MGIVDEKGEVVHSGQLDQNESRRADGRGHRQEGGLSLAVRTMPKLERKEQAAEWIRLTEEQEANASQLGTHKQKGQQPGGINAAARELGLSKSQAHRAIKVASLPEQVKQAVSIRSGHHAGSRLLEGF